MSETLPSANPAEEVLFEGRPAVLVGVAQMLVAIVTLGIAALYFWLRSKGVTYKVTTKRVIVERGLLSKRLEQIDAYRIRDFVVERPLGQRLLGNGNLLLLTADATTPTVELRGLHTDVVALYERLRYCTEQEKKKRGVRVFDVEQA